MKVIYLLILYSVFAISYIVSPIRHFNGVNGIIRYESSLDSMSSNSDGKLSSSSSSLSSSKSSINNLNNNNNKDNDEDEDSHFIRFSYKIPESSIIRSSAISANSKEKSMRMKRIIRRLKYWEQKSAENLGLPDIIDFTNITTSTIPTIPTIPTTTIPKNNTKFNAFLSRRLKKAAEKGRIIKTDLKRLIGMKVGLKVALNVTDIRRLDIRPVVIFINKKSGGQFGHLLMSKLQELLSDVQICDLSVNRPAEYLALYKSFARSDGHNLRLVCCGGDGTVAWVLQEAKSMGLENINVGIVPLGTGNDLSGVLCDEANEILKARPYLAAAGARVIWNVDEIIERPQLILNDVVWRDSPNDRDDNSISSTATCSGTASDSNGKEEEGGNSLFCAPLDRWEIEFNRIGLISDTDADVNVDIDTNDHDHDIISSSETENESELDSRITTNIDTTNIDTNSNSNFPNNKIKTTSSSTSNIRNSNLIWRSKVTKTMNNYFGFGVDGAVSLAFDNLRKQYPGLFFSSLVNKMWYGLVGFRTFINKQKDLSKCSSIICDGVHVEIPEGTQGIIVLNINSYAGGSKLWQFQGQRKPKSYSIIEENNDNNNNNNNKNPFRYPLEGIDGSSCLWEASSMCDQTLDVVAVTSIAHLGQIRAGIANARPLCQGSNIEIITNTTLPMQIDGEPFNQRSGKINLKWSSKASLILPITTSQPYKENMEDYEYDYQYI